MHFSTSWNEKKNGNSESGGGNRICWWFEDRRRRVQQQQIENVGEITKSATKLYDKYVTLKGFLKKIVTSYRTHGTNLQAAINNSWGGKDSLEKQMINLKNKHGLVGKNIEQTLPAEDKILDVNDPEDNNDPEDYNDPEDKGPYIN